ncbi:hypothetical protein AVEN_214282-1, partial [Araneus ventricosus]
MNPEDSYPSLYDICTSAPKNKGEWFSRERPAMNPEDSYPSSYDICAYALKN